MIPRKSSRDKDREFRLETPRLVLRPFTEDDIATLSGYRSDPEVARYQSWDTPFTERQAEAFVFEMESIRPGAPGWWYQPAIELKATGEVIGDCAFQVTEDGRQGEIGFTLARAYHRQGYGSEAVTRLLRYLFEELGLHRVRAYCDVQNTASFRLMEKVGMRREAHLVENAWFKGEWSSEFWYAMLLREWRERLPVANR